MSDLPSDTDTRLVALPAADQEEGEDDIYGMLRDWFRVDRDHSSQWREEARQAFDYVAGRQWSDEDANYLRDMGRPAITFNRIGPMVKIVIGLEVGNRQEVIYNPRTMGDVQVDEILTGAAKWVRDMTDAEDEESDAFADAVITGMGWTETTLRYDEDHDGKILISRVDPIEMFWDCGSKAKNLYDARRMFRVRDVPTAEAREMFPGVPLDDLHASWASDGSDISPSRETHRYDIDQSSRIERERRTVTLVEAQWWDLQATWRALDPFTQQEISLDDASHSLLKQRIEAMGGQLMSVQQKTRRYRRAFLGSKLLEVWEGPAKGGFTWKAITAERDRNKGTWYGIVRAMMDPQQWANKWMSQSLHLMNVGAKGGIMAEASAIGDVADLEERWASPDQVVLLEDGALSDGKVQPRPVTPMPPMLPDLMQLALSSIRDCTGINLELLGMQGQDQPGILEHMRKQAGMTVLATMFDALRRYRKEQGRLLLWFITNFIADGRLIRIGSPEQARYVPLIHQPGVVEYDVDIDDTPTSPNMKEQTWQAFMELMPFLSRMPDVPPQIYLEVLKYSPLPSTVVSKIDQLMKSAPPKPDTGASVEAAMKSQAALNEARAQLAAAQAQKVGVDASIGSAQARAEHERTQAELFKTALEAQEIKARIENLRSQALLNMSKAGVTQHDAQTDRMLAVLDMLDTLVGWHQTATTTAAGAQQGTQTLQ